MSPRVVSSVRVSSVRPPKTEGQEADEAVKAQQVHGQRPKSEQQFQIQLCRDYQLPKAESCQQEINNDTTRDNRITVLLNERWRRHTFVAIM
jgi:hypothetical protein